MPPTHASGRDLPAAKLPAAKRPATKVTPAVKVATAEVRRGEMPAALKMAAAVKVTTAEVRCREMPAALKMTTAEVRRGEMPAALKMAAPEVRCREMPAALKMAAPEVRCREMPAALKMAAPEVRCREMPAATPEHGSMRRNRSDGHCRQQGKERTRDRDRAPQRASLASMQRHVTVDRDQGNATQFSRVDSRHKLLPHGTASRISAGLIAPRYIQIRPPRHRPVQLLTST